MELNVARKFLDTTFEEITLVLAGIFVVHRAPDEIIWQVMKHLDIAHENAVGKLEGLDPKAGKSTYSNEDDPHPAVDALLKKLRRPSPYER